MQFIDGEPPPSRHWIGPCVEQLKAHPGQWALVQRYVNPNSAQYAQRKLRARGCDVRSVFVNSEYELYARWPVTDA